jgi:molecular chaperone DnaK
MSAEEISAHILMNVKQCAKRQLQWNDTVHGSEMKAVITVPAYFNNAQRDATRQAGEIAGFCVLRVLNEPTAACLSYVHDLQTSSSSAAIQSEPYLCLVYDLGGGTLDVTLARIAGPEIDVLATRGDTHLGMKFHRMQTKYLV